MSRGNTKEDIDKCIDRQTWGNLASNRPNPPTPHTVIHMTRRTLHRDTFSGDSESWSCRIEPQFGHLAPCETV